MYIPAIAGIWVSKSSDYSNIPTNSEFQDIVILQMFPDMPGGEGGGGGGDCFPPPLFC